MSKFIFQAILTPEEEGGYSVEFPDLPGCFSCGDTFNDAVAMGADAAKTYVASLLGHGDTVPEPQRHRCPSGTEDVMVFFETDTCYVEDECLLRLANGKFNEETLQAMHDAAQGCNHRALRYHQKYVGSHLRRWRRLSTHRTI